MFEWLAPFDIILVTGPQRSGTTICAKMIQADTDKYMVDEGGFDVTDLVRWADYVTTTSGGVIQCPSMCRYVHWFGKRNDLAVVLMRRSIDEIIASEKRIQWDGAFELARYNTQDGPVSAVKYNYWDTYQKGFVKHAFEIEYRSLESHRLWVPDERRKDFSFKQTEEALENDYCPVC